MSSAGYKYHGSYEVQKKLSDHNYIRETPDRRKAAQHVHVNLRKMYNIKKKTLNNYSKLNVDPSATEQVDHDGGTALIHHDPTTGEQVESDGGMHLIGDQSIRRPC